jgi:hypothetical protein
MELSRLFRSFLTHFHIFADFCLCSWRIFCIANVPLFLTVCDVIFCVLAKCITGDFSRFFKGASTFLTPKCLLLCTGHFGDQKCLGSLKKTLETADYMVYLHKKLFGREFRAFLSPAEWFGTKIPSSKCFSIL